jgi:hypothetical protein
LINAEIRMFEVPLRAVYNVKFLRVFEVWYIFFII